MMTECSLFFSVHSVGTSILSIITVTVMILQFILEGYRWQMLPSNLTACLFLIVTIGKINWPHPLFVVGWLLGGLSIGFTLITALGLPVIRWPKASGPYSVGTTTIELTDGSRNETFANGKGPRRLTIEAWYPALRDLNVNRASYLDPHDGIARALAKFLNLPSFVFTHLSLIKTNSFIDAKVLRKEGPFPVLIYSHGFYGYTKQNTVLIEELVSHGYIVLSISHPYESLAVKFPSGRVVTYDEEWFIQSIEEDQRTKSLVNHYLKCHEMKEKEKLLKQIVENSPLAGKSLTIWTEDTRFVIGQLQVLNDDPHCRLYQSIDYTKIGLFGFSFGGTTATQVSMIDDRIRAGIDMDGLQYGKLFGHSLSVPFMFMESSSFKGQNDPYYCKTKNNAYRVNVKKTGHFNFTDFSLLLPILKLLRFFEAKENRRLGPIDGKRMICLTNDYILSFFNVYLKGEDKTKLMRLSNQYPEAKMDMRSDLYSSSKNESY